MYFYPRSPCGERRLMPLIKFFRGIFLSTLSLRRATCLVGFVCLRLLISIHALLAESDMIHPRFLNVRSNFYPRSPCGERHLQALQVRRAQQISIHALLAESDAEVGGSNQSIVNFYPRSPCGERQPENPIIAYDNDFYPRSPCGERQSLWSAY